MSENLISNLSVNSTKHLKILVVEDDEIIQTVHRFMLEKLGFQVDVVGTGQEGIDRTADTLYAAVLLDLGLPDITGAEVITAIRTREQITGQHLPIVVNSAHADAKTLQDAKDRGADIVMSKPVTNQALQSHLAQLGLFSLSSTHGN